MAFENIYEVRASRSGGFTVFNRMSREHVAHRNERLLADDYANCANELARKIGLRLDP